MRSRLGIATLFAVVIAFGFAPVARAAATTNFSDQWWVPGESGWGASVNQQDKTLLVNLFVYGADNKPTWFVAAATLQGATADGRTIFAGDLYRTTGPNFAGPFNPSAVQESLVGTLIFDADSPTTAMIFYTVDGTNVTKNTTRQTFAAESYSGNYGGGLVRDFTGCTVDGLNGHSEELGPVEISQSKTALTMTFDSIDGLCTFNGSFAQSGHMGSANGTFECELGVRGTMKVAELAKTTSGITARVSGSDQFCSFNGRIAGVRR